ncbi:low molecular weight phosphotyrosine protein phosphatase [Pseudohoeflea suaedae]|uniref:protein-tyrosine-phosphatase n=1 Tax=Pseudohoeflea suaedae TaxID=877384 RepID=A0A4R5PL97_9HYPH|nr:low molecular weight protein-tyrosine-phosphatase [Pseudohoeflea suaedae]TDH37704.1 low molecular weight phosphotyrosine protein phosphatase [Pseudohoeflea suaedae]
MTDRSRQSNAQPPSSVLFVCLGNICRSPLAEGIFRHHVGEAGLSDKVRIDSAGTGAWHAGGLPDRRSIATAARHGLDITGQRARRITDSDFRDHDLILAMDRSNRDTLLARAPNPARDRIHLFMEHALGIPQDVPDPYYGEGDGFEAVYRMLVEGSSALVENLFGGRRSTSG